MVDELGGRATRRQGQVSGKAVKASAVRLGFVDFLAAVPRVHVGEEVEEETGCSGGWRGRRGSGRWISEGGARAG